jgi:tetratricopeptide (TPR) repeat protein
MTTSRKHLAATFLFAGALSLAASLAFAASGGGSSTSGSSTPSCKSGTVWNPQKGKCEKASSSKLDDKTLYTEGRNLALAGRYDEALTALNAVRKPDSMALTMIGYSLRKLGKYEDGVAYYRKALALDPNNPDTHEYLGEAYAEKGKLDLAKAELVRLSAICGTSCEQYRDLEKAIAGKPDAS